MVTELQQKVMKLFFWKFAATATGINYFSRVWKTISQTTHTDCQNIYYQPSTANKTFWNKLAMNPKIWHFKLSFMELTDYMLLNIGECIRASVGLQWLDLLYCKNMNIVSLFSNWFLMSAEVFLDMIWYNRLRMYVSAIWWPKI